MTNYERIKVMSVEELNAMLTLIAPEDCLECYFPSIRENCYSCIQMWLESEVDDELRNT